MYKKGAGLKAQGSRFKGKDFLLSFYFGLQITATDSRKAQGLRRKGKSKHQILTP